MVELLCGLCGQPVGEHGREVESEHDGVIVNEVWCWQCVRTLELAWSDSMPASPDMRFQTFSEALEVADILPAHDGAVPVCKRLSDGWWCIMWMAKSEVDSRYWWHYVPGAHQPE